MKQNSWVRLLTYITGLVNQELLLQNEDLATENRILRAHLPARLHLSDPERTTLAEIGKKLVNEHRPPASLWAMTADSGASYPSGHATAAAVLAVSLVVVAATLAGRSAAFVLGGLYAVAVAGSRVYLADHYPPDVIGGMLCAVAAAFIVTGLAALPALQPLLRRLDAPKASTAEASGRS